MHDQSLIRTDEEFVDAAVAYSLGALPRAEAAEFEARAASPAARATLASFAPAVEALALSVPARTPPPRVREGLLAQLDGGVRPFPTARVALWRRAGPWLAAAAMLLLAVGLGAVLSAQQRELADLRAALVAPRVVPMQATALAPHAQGRFYLAPDSRQAILVVADMPPLADDKAYQLWLLRPDGSRDDGGVFRVDSGGYGTHLIRAPQPMRAYAGVGVTVEPRAGSAGPTSERLISGSFVEASNSDW